MVDERQCHRSAYDEILNLELEYIFKPGLPCDAIIHQYFAGGLGNLGGGFPVNVVEGTTVEGPQVRTAAV